MLFSDTVNEFISVGIQKAADEEEKAANYGLIVFAKDVATRRTFS